VKIAVVGATGHTGQHVVAQALARGDEVLGIARRPESLPARVGLTTAAADVLNRAALTEVLAGTNAVVSTLGIGTSRQPTVLYSDGISNILHAMCAHGIRKLAVISAVPAGPRAGLPFQQRYLFVPVLGRLFRATYDDMRRMEELLSGSDLDWVCLRPPRLVDRKATGSYRADTRPLPGGGSITHADLATALLGSLDHPEVYRHPAYVAN
jgi:putative NADH-flavin reductase